MKVTNNSFAPIMMWLIERKVVDVLGMVTGSGRRAARFSSWFQDFYLY